METKDLGTKRKKETDDRRTETQRENFAMERYKKIE